MLHSPHEVSPFSHTNMMSPATRTHREFLHSMRECIQLEHCSIAAFLLMASKCKAVFGELPSKISGVNGPCGCVLSASCRFRFPAGFQICFRSLLFCFVWYWSASCTSSVCQNATVDTLDMHHLPKLDATAAGFAFCIAAHGQRRSNQDSINLARQESSLHGSIGSKICHGLLYQGRAVSLNAASHMATQCSTHARSHSSTD